ncbi:hypothetical protein [Bradyrhizobium sp. SZCCHNRI3052]|uniref:hypothetical protein n=1 Tax=Bradyrhizobium sp. SZCCHNRI3052 TaxID=3057295 RepID=UPI002915EA26|nr:hypothetical protein [Bradyrhizobium sp. SZCCHNRI3052]
MFAVLNVLTRDDAKLKLQVPEWCEAVGEYPLFAIRKAAKWAVTGRHKLPSLSAFTDASLAIGNTVLQHDSLLRGLLTS